MKTRLCKSLFVRILALSLATCMSIPNTAFAASTVNDFQAAENPVLINEETSSTEDSNSTSMPLAEETSINNPINTENVEQSCPMPMIDEPRDESETSYKETEIIRLQEEETPKETSLEIADQEPENEAIQEVGASDDIDGQAPEDESMQEIGVSDDIDGQAPEDESMQEVGVSDDIDGQEPEDESNQEVGISGELAPNTINQESEGETAQEEVVDNELTPEIAEQEIDKEKIDENVSGEKGGETPSDPTNQGPDSKAVAEEETDNPAMGSAAEDEPTYTLTLDLNGADWSDFTDYAADIYKDGITAAGGENIFLPIEEDADRIGYQLLGWTTTKNGEAVIEDNKYILRKDETLYAKWKKLTGLNLNLNGGSWTEDDEYYKSIFENGYYTEKNTSVGLPSEYDVIRKGYILIGWTLKKNEGKVYEDEYTLKKDTTLYARWQKTCCVKLKLNGGQWSDDYHANRYKNSVTVLKNEYFSLPDKDAAIRKGYILAGWTVKKNTGEVLTGDNKITKDITFYARWEKPVCVKLNLNGGQWREDYDYYKELFKNGQTVAKNTCVDLPDGYDVTRKGYKLKGWTVKKNKGDGLYWYTATKNITLYALWVKTVTLTLDAGEGYFQEEVKEKKAVFTVEKGSRLGNSVAIYFDWNLPSCDGKVFGGWYKDSKLKKPAKKSDVISKNTTLYSKWLTKTYKITVKNLKGADFYYYNGRGSEANNSDDSSSSFSFYIAQGDEIGTLYAYKDYQRGHFYLDKECTSKPLYDTFIPTKNTTIYTKFFKDIYITYDYNGGTNIFGGTENETILSASGLMLDIFPEAFREGYYLVGWYDTKKSSNILSTSHIFKKNTTIKAKWKKGIKVTFNPKGGTFPVQDETVEGSRWFTNNKKTSRIYYVKPKASLSKYIGNFPTPEKSGYAFVGWKSSLTKKTVKNIFTEKPAKDVTYTAVWSKGKKTVKITLMAGEGSIYDNKKGLYTTKVTLAVPNNMKLSDLNIANTSEGLYLSIYHDEPYNNLVFKGWSLKKNGNILKNSYKLTKDLTLYPVWKKAPGLRIALVTNGGAINGQSNNAPYVYHTSKGSTLKLPTSSNIEREGYTFVGWYTDAKCTKKVSKPSKYKVTKSCYLYAKWKKK